MSARLGIGLAAVARPAYITSGRDADLGTHRDVETLRDRTWQVLDAAVACGVDYIDVARSYGRAEEFLAGWLDAHPGAAVEVGSKWGYRYVGDWRTDAAVHEVKDHSITAFTTQLALTRATLGPRFDVYHVHSATLETGVLADTSLHTQMAALRDEGVRVGISTSGPRQADAIRRALEIHVGGRALFTSIQSTWNVLEPSAGPALAEAAGAGARVIVKEPVANGLLAPGGQDGSPAAAKAAALAAKAGIGVDRLAIAVAMARPWAWRVLSGGVDGAQVRSNAAAANVDLRVVDTAVLEELSDLAQPAEEYWAARSARAWS
ncbi:aldo/keto reductase [Pseudonocardia sp. N23]|uniref:aldo/keto reductase n=1 Tax=Pseudonocardia sp. N23 TaxID=1987376 RepID=UPI000BFDC66B|nr:aldo/keto reductase [Pseudonocardia sp. N23]GAY10495.1 L-fuco-beta-pyranose dehydrogenase [Pseudonocardia sp. N23]